MPRCDLPSCGIRLLLLPLLPRPATTAATIATATAATSTTKTMTRTSTTTTTTHAAKAQRCPFFCFGSSDRTLGATTLSLPNERSILVLPHRGHHQDQQPLLALPPAVPAASPPAAVSAVSVSAVSMAALRPANKAHKEPAVNASVSGQRSTPIATRVSALLPCSEVPYSPMQTTTRTVRGPARF